MSEPHSNFAATGNTVDGAASQSKLGTLTDRVRSLRMPAENQARRSRGSWLPWVLCLLLAGAVGYVGYLYYTAQAQLVQLESDYQRSLRLRRTGTLADLDFEKADSLYFAMKEKCRQLEIDYELLKQGPRDINIQAAQARISQAQADLNRTQWYL